MARRIIRNQWEKARRKIKEPIRIDFNAKKKLPSEEYLKKIKVLAKLPTRVKFQDKKGNWLKFNAHKITYSLSVKQAKHYSKLVKREIEERIKSSMRHLMADVTYDYIQEWVYGK